MKKIMLVAVLLGLYGVAQAREWEVWKSTHPSRYIEVYGKAITTTPCYVHALVVNDPSNGSYIELFNANTSTNSLKDTKRVVYSTVTNTPVWDIDFSTGIMWNKYGGADLELQYWCW